MEPKYKVGDDVLHFGEKCKVEAVEKVVIGTNHTYMISSTADKPIRKVAENTLTLVVKPKEPKIVSEDPETGIKVWERVPGQPDDPSPALKRKARAVQDAPKPEYMFDTLDQKKKSAMDILEKINSPQSRKILDLYRRFEAAKAKGIKLSRREYEIEQEVDNILYLLSK